MSHKQDALKMAIEQIENSRDIGSEAAMLVSDELATIIDERYTLRHKASTFSCYVSSEEKEQKISKKETKSKKLLKKLFGF